ncbi:hypothetical protein KAR48_10785, partial [bacterium]|nr:hypothetical protein [bacterium]
VSEHGVVSGEGWYDEGTTGVDFGVSEQTVSGGTGIQYDFRGWTGNGTISYSGNSLSSTVTMNSPIREEVNWKTQYFLTTTENPAAYGDIAPAPPGAWYDKNTTQSVTALSGTGYQWSSWGGDLASAPNNPTTIMMNEPKSVEANFEIEVSITIQSNPVGRKFSVDGIEYTDTHVFNWIVGREHSLLGAYMQNDGEATRYIFDSWSDEGERAHQYVVPSDYAEVVINYQKQYKLTLVTERGNIISNSLNGYYNHGDAATFAINSLLIQEGNTTRYAFDGWLGSGGTYAYSGTDSSHTIPMNHPVTETVSWQKQYYLDVESEHGTVSGEGWYNEGQSDVAFGINVQTVPGGTGIQYDFRGWTGAGTISYSGTALSGTVTMLNPISEVADWQTQYYLSTSENPDVGGDITPAPPGKWYDKDESADISAVVNSGDTWHGFTGSDNLITMDNPISINMDGPKNVTANFMDFIQVVITSDHIGARFKVREDGEADEVEYTTPHTFSWEEGTTYIISVDAENIIDGSTEHTFVKWDGNESREHEFIVPSTNMAKTFNVTARYLLTINSEYGVPVGAGFQSEGTNAQFSIDAIVTNTEDNSRDSLITWSGDFTGTANPGSIFINGPKEITANWQRQYKLTIETQQEGANPQGSGWYNEGATADFSVTSPIEYSGGTERRQLTGWTGEGNGSYTTGNDLVVISHSVVMNNPIIEHAPYHTRYPLNTTVAPLQAGTITADPTGGWYVAGEDVVVNALAKEGYKWSEWTGDITSNSSTTMVHMDGAKDITANFLDFFQIVITSDHEGIIFEVDDVEYTTPHTFSWEMGAIHSIKVSQVQSIDDNAEYTFVKWDDNEPREHEFIVPSADVTKTFNVTARYLLKINSEKGSPVGAGFYSEDITAQFSVESSITNAQGDMRDNFIGWSGDFTAVTTTGSLAMNGPKEITASWQRQFRLTLVTPHQQANPQGGGWYDEGTKADFSVITPYEYGEDLRNQLIGWVGVGDGSYSTGDDPVVADTSVIMNSGIRQQALWKTQYALNITKSPAVGGIVTTDPSGRWHDFGTDVTITAAANEGYRWHQWTGNISSNASTTIIGINSVRNVTANFEQILAATINTSPSDRKYVVDGSEYSGHNMFGWVEGETHSLSALTPQLDDEDELTRYLFGSWSHGVAQTHNYLVPANAPSLTAYFSKQYRLEVESDHGSPFGEGWDNVGVSRQFGITVSTVEVSSREKFEFQGWTTNSQDGYSGTDLNKILTMNEGIRQIARWDTMYSLIYSVSPSLKGSIAATKNKAWFKRGESVTLTATPIDPETTPYLFTGWTGDTISTEEVLTLDMNKPYTVVANYRLLKHAVTRTALFRDPKGVVHQDSGGVILATPDATEFEHRSKVVFKAQPRTGTKFIEWGGDLSGTDIEQSFNILEDKTFTATFVFDDRQEPYISDNYPLNGASDVPVNTGVQFIVKDDIYGVDLSTLNVSVAGRSIIANGTAISAEVTIRTLKQGYQILYTPVVSFTPSTTVSIAASCRDLADPVNSFSGTYSFSTGASIISEKQESSIPPTGGTLNLPPGVILTIPAGAISDTTQIIVGRVDNAPAVPDSLKKNLLGHTYYFGPDGLQFNLPVTIRIPFDVADLARLGIKSAAALRVYCYTTLVRIWEDVGDIVVDMQNGHVTFTISHFSYFQISATTPEIVPGEIINYPNPFPAPGASTTTIKYMLDHDTEASLKIYDVSSRLVKILVQEGTAVIADTEYNVEWDGRNGQDDDVSNNVYFGVLKTSSGKTYIRKIVLLR